MGEPYRTQRLVEFHDTDMAGIVHFSAFFRYMESAEHELLRSIGLSVHSLVEGQYLSFPRVSASCQFRAPARCEELIDIAVSISRIGNKSLTYEFIFTYDDREIAHGQMTSVCCRVDPGKPMASVPIPQAMLENLQQFAT